MVKSDVTIALVAERVKGGIIKIHELLEMNPISIYDYLMNRITVSKALDLAVELSRGQEAFYRKYRKNAVDESLKKLLATMIDQENQYAEYVQENRARVDFQNEFSSGEDEPVEADLSEAEFPEVNGLSKLDFLKAAVRIQEFSLSLCQTLSGLARTAGGRQLFKELADEKKRHIVIVRDRLELEEMF